MYFRYRDAYQDFFEQQLKKYPTDPRIAAEVWRQLTQPLLLSEADLKIVPGDQDNAADRRSTFVSIPPEIQSLPNRFGRLWIGQPERDSLLEISVFLADRLPYRGCDCFDCLLFSPFRRRFEETRGEDALDRQLEIETAEIQQFESAQRVLKELEDENQDLFEALESKQVEQEVLRSECSDLYQLSDQLRSERDAAKSHNRDLKRELYLLRQTQVSPSGGETDAQNNAEPLSYATCLDVVNFARANLDFVEFADRPKLDLDQSHDVHAEELLKCLRGFEAWCEARPQMGVDAWLMSAESEFQLGGRKRFAMAEGDTVKRRKGARLFPVPRWADKHGYAPMEAHVKFGFSLRLYYRVYWRDQHPQIVVGYIGQHLDVASSN